MNLESPKVSVQKSASEVFEFLTKVENFEKIMPENTDKFEAQDESFLFALKGMPEIRLKLQEKIEHNKIVLGSTSDKFPFTLTGNISKNNENSSEVQLIFEGKFNAMMAMMIKGPIQKFIDTLTANIGKL
jgi:carbon monoxide dehydrogenase subunit G